MNGNESGDTVWGVPQFKQEEMNMNITNEQYLALVMLNSFFFFLQKYK